MDYPIKIEKLLENIAGGSNSSAEPVLVLDNISVSANTTNAIVFVKVETPLKPILIGVVNKGASTSLNIDAFTSTNQVVTFPLQPLTLNASTTTNNSAEIPVDIAPMYLGFIATNNDSNATTYDVWITRGV